MKTKRFLSLLLALEMLFCMLPVSSFASEAPEFPDETESILNMQEEVREEEPVTEPEPEPEDPVIELEILEEIQEENHEELSDAVKTEDSQEDIKEEPEAEEKKPEPFEPKRMFDFDDPDVSTIYETAPALDEEEFARLTGIEDWTDYSYRLYDLRLEDASGAVSKGGAVEFAPGFANPADSMRVFLIKEEVFEDDEEDEEAAEDEDEDRDGEKRLVSYEAEIEFDKESQRVKFYAESLPSRWLFVGEPDQWVKLQSRISSLPEIEAVENAQQALELETRLLEVDAMADALREAGESDVEIFDRVSWEKYNVLRELVGSFRRDEKIAAVNAAVAMLPELEAVEDAEQAASIEAQLAAIDVLLQELRDAGMTEEALTECISLEKYSAALEALNAYKETLEEEQKPEEIVLTATVENIVITLTADAGAFGDVQPEELTLSVRKIEEEVTEETEKIEEAVAEKREADARVASSFKFDITVLNPAGEELQPVDGASVRVSFALAEVVSAALDVNVYHVKEESDETLTAEALTAEQEIASGTEEEPRPEETVVTVETDGFSIYVVEFTYGPFEYVLPGDESVSLSEIQAAIGLLGTVTAAAVSNSGLFTAVQNADGQDWTVTALQPFDTKEWMKITIGGVEYEIAVTDENSEDIYFESDVLFSHDVTVNGEPRTIYCLQEDYIWPDGVFSPNGPYYESVGTSKFLNDERLEIMRRLMYAGYPNDTLGILRKAYLQDEGLYDIPEDREEEYREYAAYYTQRAIWEQMARWPDIEGNYDPLYDDAIIAGYGVNWGNAILALIEYANGDDPLPTTPSTDEVVISGSGLFTYNNGKWSTSELKITEPADFGIYYTLELPEGITAYDSSNRPITHIEENAPFYLVADDKTSIDTAGIKISSNLSYPSKVSAYETDVVDEDAGPLQTMLSVAMNSMTMKGALSLSRTEVGDLKVTKAVEGDGADPDDKFAFTVTLDSEIPAGTYGEMTFATEGGKSVAHFTLKGGETKLAQNLPAGVHGTVTEADCSSMGYATTKNGDSGEIIADNTMVAEFLNTKAASGSLTIEKTVAGNAADHNKYFHFTITLSDTTINDTYSSVAFTNGVGTITLKHNERKIIEGLPGGTDYTVTEDNKEGYSTEGYTTTKTGDTGTISSAASAVATFVNTRNTFGSLKITKVLAGNAVTGDTKDFSFTVTLSDDSINGTYSGVAFTNGVGTITLKGGESKIIEGLPNGVDYTVTEADYTADGYVTDVYDGEGQIIGDQTVETHFVNTRNQFSSLTIGKRVEGNAADPEKYFHFNISTNPVLIGTYSNVTFGTDGVATIGLKHNETKSIENLPHGTTYTITEVDNDGYITTVSGETGQTNTAVRTFEISDPIAVEFVNTRNTYGDLRVEKTVTGNAADLNKEFRFRVELTDTAISGNYGEMTFNNGISAPFTLKHGQSITATGLPNGVGYTVLEQDYADEGYGVTSKTGDTGTVIGGGEVTAKFVNTRNAEGSLTIYKILNGNAVESDREFEFTITLSDTSINDEHDGIQFTNGVGHFKLKGGESQIINLPNGVGYTVSEDPDSAPGYTIASRDASGTISEGKSSVAEFMNTRNTFEDLTVTKAVSDNLAETGKEFIFTVTLSDDTITGAYGDMTFEKGIANFALTAGQSKTAQNLPNGVRYTVTEKDYAEEGFITTKEGDTGTIVGNGGGKTAVFTNTRDARGSLSILKILDGNAVETSKDFVFTVTLSDTSFSESLNSKKSDGTTDTVTFAGGISDTITLQGGQSITIENMPHGVNYTVTEDPTSASGYEITSRNAVGTISASNPDPIAVEFKNTRNLYGDLTVSKTVTGNACDLSKEFEFTVELSDKTITGLYGEMAFQEGKATFRLKNGDNITAEDLPHGVGYTVTEEDYSSEGYVTTKTGDTGTIDGTATQPMTAAFTNTRDTFGSLKVTKTVAGNAGETGKAFSFTVALTDAEGKPVTGTYGGVTFDANGKTIFTLTSGQEKTLTGLPNGVKYKVTEDSTSAAGYTVSMTGEEGTIVGNETKTAAFTNTRNVGSLSVTKTVTGDLADKNKSFLFTFTFVNDDSGRAYNYTITGGTTGTLSSGASVYLKHGQTITISGLPTGTKYTVAESENSGYNVYKTNAEGVITTGETAKVSFTNSRSSVPATGDSSALSLWLGMMLLSLIGTAGAFLLRRKKIR